MSESNDDDLNCPVWTCENPPKDGEAYYEGHPPLVDHGLVPNETACPKCGKVGAGTIHDDLWYCLEDFDGYDGCGAPFDPYEVSDTEKKPKW